MTGTMLISPFSVHDVAPGCATHAEVTVFGRRLFYATHDGVPSRCSHCTEHDTFVDGRCPMWPTCTLAHVPIAILEGSDYAHGIIGGWTLHPIIVSYRHTERVFAFHRFSVPEEERGTLGGTDALDQGVEVIVTRSGLVQATGRLVRPRECA